MRDDKDIKSEFGIDLSGHERRLVHQGTETGRWSGTTPPISEIDRMIRASKKMVEHKHVILDEAEISNLRCDWFFYGFTAALAQALVCFIVYVEYLK